MPRYSKRVSNGQVMVKGELLPVDLLIDGAKVAGVVSRADATEAEEFIDATGKVVLPGTFDTHAHTREAGYTHKEDFLSASRAVPVGGVTTMIKMPNVEPPTDRFELFEQKRAVAAVSSIIDWGHWVAGTNPD